MVRLHQMGMRMRQRLHHVQNLAICTNAREKASSRLLHPDVIAHTNATNTGNKRFFSIAKVDDTILTHQKKQRDMGQYKAMKYFEKEAKMNKLTWLVLIFDDVKGVGRGTSATAWQCYVILRIKRGRGILGSDEWIRWPTN